MPFRLFDRAKFAIERWLVRGTWHRVAVVALLILSISLLGGILVIIWGHGFGDLPGAVWWSFLRLSDPGYLGDDAGLFNRTVSTVLTGHILVLGWTSRTDSIVRELLLSRGSARRFLGRRALDLFSDNAQAQEHSRGS